MRRSLHEDILNEMLRLVAGQEDFDAAVVDELKNLAVEGRLVKADDIVRALRPKLEADDEASGA